MLPFGIAAAFLVAPAMTIDSSVYMAMDLPDTVFPHFPIGYPLFTRGMALLIEFVTTGSTAHNLNNVGHFSTLDVNLILLVQHVLTIFASAYLAYRLSAGLVGVLLFTAVLYLNPLTLIATHGLLSESFNSLIVFVLVGKTIDILRSERIRWTDVAGLMLVALVGSLFRFPLLATAAILPITLFLRGLLAPEQSVKARFGQLGISVGFAALTLVVVALPSSAINNFATSLSGAEARSVIGRAGVYLTLGTRTSHRSPEFVVTPDMAEMSAQIAQTAAPEVAADIMFGAEHADTSWFGPFNDMRKAEFDGCSACTAQQAGVAADLRLSKAAMAVITSGNPIYLRHVLIRVRQYLTPYSITKSGTVTRPLNRLDSPFKNNQTILSYDDVKTGFPIHNMESIYPLSYSALWVLRIYGWSFALAAALVCMILRRREAAAYIVPGLVASGVAYAIAMSIVTVYIDRYGYSLDIMVLTALVVAVSVLLTRRPRDATASPSETAAPIAASATEPSPT